MLLAEGNDLKISKNKNVPHLTRIIVFLHIYKAYLHKIACLYTYNFIHSWLLFVNYKILEQKDNNNTSYCGNGIFLIFI